MIEQTYRGCLLAAHPKRSDPYTKQGTFLILDHDKSGAIGLRINKPLYNSINFESVMINVGLPTDKTDPLYKGGPENQHRIHIVHSLDWYTTNTTKITNYIGVSHDISILAAISNDSGPDYFRAVAGYTKWPPGQIEGEIAGEDPWDITHSWSIAPATIETVFEYDEYDQWHTVITESNKLQINNWF